MSVPWKAAGALQTGETVVTQLIDLSPAKPICMFSTDGGSKAECHRYPHRLLVQVETEVWDGNGLKPGGCVGLAGGGGDLVAARFARCFHFAGVFFSMDLLTGSMFNASGHSRSGGC